MKLYNENTRREFLRKLIAEPEDKVKPHHEHLMFYKGLSEWPEEWSGNNV